MATSEDEQIDHELVDAVKIACMFFICSTMTKILLIVQFPQKRHPEEFDQNREEGGFSFSGPQT